MRRGSKPAAVGIIVCLALVASVIVLALRADGREATESTTNDGGAWLVNQRAGSIGHLNREVAELSAAVRVREPSSSFEVHQPEGAVVVHATTSDALEIVDARTHLRVNSLQLPERATVAKYHEGLIISADGPFRIWRLTSEAARDVQSLDSVLPIWEGDRSPFQVSAGGIVAVSGTATTLTILPVDGDELVVDLGSFGQVDQILFDGEQPLVKGGTQLGIVTGDTVRSVANDVEPGAIDAVSSVDQTGSVVAVRPSGDVVRVDLNTGETRILGGLESGDPVPPIEHQGCVYAVGHEPPMFWVQCGDDESRSIPLATQPDVELRLRLVNDWVWVNDLTTGNLWLVDDELDLSLVDDWGAVLPQNPVPDDELADSIESDDDIVDDTENPDAEDAQTVEADPFDEDGINEPPVAFDDNDFFTHAGRPVVINVVDNDEDPDNDVLLVESVENLSGPDATIAATNDGRGIQVTPAPGFEGTVRFSYRITDGRGGSDSATGSVTVQARLGIDNNPPVAVTDIGSITAGEKLIINVIANDYDPDGDSVVLIEAAAPSGSLSFDPSGQVIYEPDTSSEEGEIELTYRIADDFGEIADGRVRATIRLQESNQPPDARNDGAVTVVGQPVNINVLRNDTDPDGDELFVAQRPQIFEPPGAEVFTTITPDGEFVFIPDEAGTYLFSYAASDDQDSDTAQIRIEVSPSTANRPPVAVRDDIIVPQGESRIAYVLSNDGDPDGDIVGIVDVNVTSGSGLRVEPFQDVGFRVFAEGPGPSRRTFRYSISDGASDPVEATVVVSVADPALLNQPPLAQPDFVEIRPGSSISVPVLDNDFDPEGGPLRVVDVSEPAGGSASIGAANSTVRVSVDPETVTSFSVSYDVTDEQGNRTASVIRVRVVPPGEPNRPPIARPDSARTPFEAEVSIAAVANDSDPDGDPIRVESITAQPANGIATVDQLSGDVLYTPANGYSGTDRFSYAVVDALGARTIGEVLVGVLPEPRQNRDPIAIDDSYITVATGETIDMAILVNDSDPDGDQLRIASVSSPSAGIVDSSAETRVLTYTAPVQQTEDVAVVFDYTIGDGNGGSASATITVLVQATPPQPTGTPIAIDDTVGPFQTGDDVRVDVVANDSDPDGPINELDVDVFAAELQVEAQEVVFAAPAESTDFVYQITDVDGNSATARIIVEVFNPVPPVAVDDQFGPVKQGDTVQIDVLANDYDLDSEPDTLQLSSVSGEASVTNGLVTLVAPADSTQYSYTIVDPDGLEATATLSLIVTQNRAPTVTPQTVSTDFETEVQIDLAPFATDPDDDPLFFSCCQSARNGSPVVVDAGEQVLFVTFTPDTGFSGDAVFTYEVDDQFGHLVAGSVTVTVGEQPNRPPTAVDGSAEIQAPRPGAPAVSADVDLAALADDLDDEPLTFSINSQPGQELSAQVDGSFLRITATEDSDPGSTTLDYVVTDPAGESVQATIDVTILEPQNQPPTAADQSIDIPASNSTSIDLRDVGIDADPDEVLTFTIDASPAAGLTVTLTGDSVVTIAAAVSASGTSDSFSYTVTDRMNEQATGTISISVNDPDEAPPTAADDSANTIQGVAVEIPVLENDADPLGRGLTIVDEGATSDGTVTVNGSVLEFTPNAAFFGTTDFIYTIRDAADVSTRQATAVVNIEVTGRPSIPGAPTCAADSRLANLTWTRPADNGATITGYQIEHDQGGALDLGPATNHQWTALDNGTEYRFRIAAENLAGTSLFSPWSVACRPNIEPERPSPPQVTHGDRFLDISWSEPANDGTIITSYEVRIGGGVVQTSTDTNLRWTGLRNGDSYTFEVAARNDEGLSDFSTASSPEHPSRIPNAPVIGATTRAGLIGASASGILEVHWTPVPVADDGGDTITHYRIEREGGGSAQVNGANASTYIWSGLPNGQDNRFRVFAVNRDGDSAASAWSPSARACTVPDAPTGVSASPGDRQATVTFSAPSGNGGCTVTDYDVREVGSTGNGTSHAAAGTKTIGGLDNDSTYAFEVRANNVIGSSGWVSSNAVVPAGLPICGSGITVTSIGHNAASYSWGAANFNGASPQGYEVSINSGPWTFISNGTSGTTAVNENSSTTVRLRARNQLGASPQCGSVTFQTCPATPPPPGQPSISANQSNNTISTSWNAVTIACTSQPQVSGSYDIDRYEIGPQTGGIADEGLATSKVYGPLNPGDEISVSVRACYTTGCGAWSPWSATEQINPLGTVQIGLGNVGNYPNDACWNASSIIASGGNPDQGCYFIRIVLAGWAGSHTVRCYSTMNTGVWQEFESFTAGNGTHNRCSYSQAGRSVLVVVNGRVQGDLSGWSVPPPAIGSNVWGLWPTN